MSTSLERRAELRKAITLRFSVGTRSDFEAHEIYSDCGDKLIAAVPDLLDALEAAEARVMELEKHLDRTSGCWRVLVDG